MTEKQKALWYFKKAIQLYKEEGFVNPDAVSEEESLGVLISQAGQWTGDYIFQAATFAFEDSNYHSFNEEFETAWNTYLVKTQLKGYTEPTEAA